jgi:hypothetical protein
VSIVEFVGHEFSDGATVAEGSSHGGWAPWAESIGVLSVNDGLTAEVFAHRGVLFDLKHTNTDSDGGHNHQGVDWENDCELHGNRTASA